MGKINDCSFEVNVHEPKNGDKVWIDDIGNPKKLCYDCMYGWIADVDEWDRPHTIIDWHFVIFDKFTEEVAKYASSKHYCQIGFTNKEACYEYCDWKYSGW